MNKIKNLNINKIMLCLTVLVFVLAAVIFVLGTVSVNKQKSLIKGKNTAIEESSAALVKTCKDKLEELKIAPSCVAVYEENLAKESDPRVRASISLGMSEYCAERIFDEGAELSQNVEEMDKKYRNAISDINVAQAALNNAMIDNEE